MRNITTDLARLADIRRRAEAEVELNAHLLLRRIYVPPSGPLDPVFLIVGEAPGEQEEDAGRPFCGVAGQLLKAMLKEAGVPEIQCTFTNVLKVRPASSQKHLDGSKQDRNRKPQLEELRISIPFLLEEVELYQPRVIIAAGATAAGAFSGDFDFRITRNRGEFILYGDRNTPVMPTYHPSFLVHKRQEKGGVEYYEMMKDLRAARRMA